MLNFLKTSFKGIASFMKPRAVLCVMLAAAFALSALLFLGQVNTFVIKHDNTDTTVQILSADIGTALSCADIDKDVYKIESSYKTGKTMSFRFLKPFPLSLRRETRP